MHEHTLCTIVWSTLTPQSQPATAAGALRRSALSTACNQQRARGRVRAACFTQDDTFTVPPPALASSIDLSADAYYAPPTTPVPRQRGCDFVVIGSGIAGLTYALKVAEFGRVAVVTKETLSAGCTAYAQGGVCAVLDPLDSVQSHAHDTMVAGNFLNDPRCGSRAAADCLML
jgi:FAD binding domain